MMLTSSLRQLQARLTRVADIVDVDGQLRASARRAWRIAAAEASLLVTGMLERSRRATCQACKTERARITQLGVLAPTHPGPFHVSQFRLEHCLECDVVFLNPIPTADDLRTLYERSEQFDSWEYKDERAAAILEYITSAIVHRQLLPRPGARCLEVGAGLAWMSRACKAQDPSVVTVAQDVTSEAVARCPWVDRYHVGELATLREREPFDLVSLTHVIEHLVDPFQTVIDLSARLKPGGKLFITAPFRPEGWPTLRPDLDVWRRYSYLHVPAHISYLSRRWFKKIARRAELQLVHWDPTADRGQAFEAVLVKR